METVSRIAVIFRATSACWRNKNKRTFLLRYGVDFRFLHFASHHYHHLVFPRSYIIVHNMLATVPGAEDAITRQVRTTGTIQGQKSLWYQSSLADTRWVPQKVWGGMAAGQEDILHVHEFWISGTVQLRSSAVVILRVDWTNSYGYYSSTFFSSAYWLWSYVHLKASQGRFIYGRDYELGQKTKTGTDGLSWRFNLPRIAAQNQGCAAEYRVFLFIPWNMRFFRAAYYYLSQKINPAVGPMYSIPWGKDACLAYDGWYGDNICFYHNCSTPNHCNRALCDQTDRQQMCAICTGDRCLEISFFSLPLLMIHLEIASPQ